MKYIILLLILVNYSVKAQKPNVNLNTYKTWETVERGGISDDGKFVFYNIVNQNASTLVLKDTESRWEVRFQEVSDPEFTTKNQYFIGKLLQDTLLIFNLINKTCEKIKNVGAYESLVNNGETYLAYQDIKFNKFVLYNLISQKRSDYYNVTDFKISPNKSTAILIQKTRLNDSIGPCHLLSLTIKNGNSKELYAGENIRNLIFDIHGSQIAFFVNNKGKTEIGYSKKFDHATILTGENNRINQQIGFSAKRFKFSDDGKGIFHTVKLLNKNKLSPPLAGLQISNYKDLVLQSQISYNPALIYPKDEQLAYINISTKQIEQLTYEKEDLPEDGDITLTNKWVIVETNIGNVDEPFMTAQKISYYLRSIETGESIPLETNRSKRLNKITFSPGGKYLVYYDSETGLYSCYNLLTRTKVILTSSIATKTTRYMQLERINSQNYPAGILTWVKEDAILIFGTYDIWCLDPDGKKDPTTITNNLGEKNKTIFNLLTEIPKQGFNWDDLIILTSFNTSNKEEGFYLGKISTKNKIQKISSSNYLSFNPNYLYSSLISKTTIAKAKNSTKYLMLRQSASSYPNYFVTSDLLNYTPVSNLHPHKEFNWLTSELHTYVDSRGKELQGILYKPEDFDSTKHYPILFEYYQKQTQNLNQFPSITPPFANFSIPIAVTNGYLVFCPDICSIVGQPGESALISVLAAVNHLSKFSWTDTSKMAISGHSYGGFETNYIITHSDKFKAAISCAGVSDMISMPYEIWPDFGLTVEWYVTLGPFNMGQNLVSNRDLYIKNSPLLNASNMNTPLLLLHNELDRAVPVRQSRQFYLLLRNLQKPVWWLNYESEAHMMQKEENIIDYNNKAMEFLNHYLKNDSVPEWTVKHN